MKVLKDGKFRVSLEEDGYTIRPGGYNGAVFRIDFNNSVNISISSSWKFRQDAWDELQKEIKEGFSYVEEYKRTHAGATSFGNEIKSSYIKKRDLKPGGVYERETGDIVIYFGKGSLYYNGMLGTRCINCEGCNEIFLMVGNTRTPYRISEEKDVLTIETPNWVRMNTYTSKFGNIVAQIGTVKMDPSKTVVKVKTGENEDIYTIRCA